MKDYRESVYSTVLEVEGTKYLFQGKTTDQINMFREVNDLLECERDNVQRMIGELE